MTWNFDYPAHEFFTYFPAPVKRHQTLRVRSDVGLKERLFELVSEPALGVATFIIYRRWETKASVDVYKARNIIQHCTKNNVVTLSPELHLKLNLPSNEPVIIECFDENNLRRWSRFSSEREQRWFSYTRDCFLVTPYRYTAADFKYADYYNNIILDPSGGFNRRHYNPSFGEVYFVSKALKDEILGVLARILDDQMTRLEKLNAIYSFYFHNFVADITLKLSRKAHFAKRCHPIDHLKNLGLFLFCAGFNVVHRCIVDNENSQYLALVNDGELVYLNASGWYAPELVDNGEFDKTIYEDEKDA